MKRSSSWRDHARTAPELIWHENPHMERVCQAGPVNTLCHPTPPLQVQSCNNQTRHLLGPIQPSSCAGQTGHHRQLLSTAHTPRAQAVRRPASEVSWQWTPHCRCLQGQGAWVLCDVDDAQPAAFHIGPVSPLAEGVWHRQIENGCVGQRACLPVTSHCTPTSDFTPVLMVGCGAPATAPPH